MKKTNKKGFTLVEIMIVVAIIGLLAAIGIPSFQKARQNSIEKSKSNNVRLVSAAAEQYAMENGQDTGDVAYGVYYEYLKGCTATDSTALDVGSASPFQKPTVTLGTEVTIDDCYTVATP
jgi:prepilin-type N-terminal cleavage/methylation domain-containing protein